MDGSEHSPGRSGRRASVCLQRRHVRCDGAALSYAGILISRYDNGELVAQRWIPLGADPSEEDDELLIEQLRAALLWQAD
ncbi:hypothetical protein [Amycolatopsis jiangsuensis]|uniref:Uncharacterized protein n=1 Tax=Amycolatopsis jiangsuensis TaxID=1181879 RepID=A0A840IWQ6_9PSEU|nr:hypothetical protein [Amycolatopsis jiangsuensis]MBB4685642.1 hypothetical protein [Amycolatopsis jiangsuensis]